MSKKKTTKTAEASAKPAPKRGTKTAARETGKAKPTGAKATKAKSQAAATIEAAQDVAGATVGDVGAKEAQVAKSGKKNGGRAKGGGGKPKRTSALDAAAQVLQASGQPMRSRELIAAMEDQGLWKSPAGATPHATLYAAMTREINVKGTAARFVKTDRGLFAFNAEAK